MPETVSSELPSERRRLTQTLQCYAPKNTERCVTKQEYEHAHDFRYAGWNILLAPTLNNLKVWQFRVQVSYNVWREKKKNLYYLTNTTGLLSN